MSEFSKNCEYSKNTKNVIYLIGPSIKKNDFFMGFRITVEVRFDIFYRTTDFLNFRCRENQEGRLRITKYNS